MDRSFRNLAASMSYLGKPPRQPRAASTSSGLRLQPLGNEAPAAPAWTNPLGHMPAIDSLDSHVALSQSPQLSRSPSGRLALVRSMRRSEPSLMRHSFPPDATQAQGLSELSWSRMGELAAPQPSTPKRSQKDVRLRRVRRPADFGASPAQGACRRGHSCAGTASSSLQAELRRCEQSVQALRTVIADGEEDQDTGVVECAERGSTIAQMPVKGSAARCESMPPTGTSKADKDAAAVAKAKAVAMLQQLFFQEMAKGSQDPSGAAARALLRLSEAPQSPAECSPEVTKAAPIAMAPPPEVEVPAEAPEVEAEAEAQAERHSPMFQQVPGARPFMPQRPTERIGTRRPRALSRVVAVRS